MAFCLFGLYKFHGRNLAGGQQAEGKHKRYIYEWIKTEKRFCDIYYYILMSMLNQAYLQVTMKIETDRRLWISGWRSKQALRSNLSAKRTQQGNTPT